jgi:alkanesulfonate monooxygenase SsuD/methylene tetrahydromethanopterin reductase-like flavin-dependent oxidoreductase (luciferase family)
LTAHQQVSFGLSLPNRAVLFGLPPPLLLDAAELAEASGAFDSVWVGDNFLSKPRLEAIVTLSALAARTTRVKLGVICMASFPLRHPLPLALQWASLDVLSGGRTILGVCIGGSSRWGGQFAVELAAMDVTDSERISRLVEGVDVLRRLWGPEPVTTFRGRFYRFENVQFRPKPVQPRIPITVASNPLPRADPRVVERALRRVARIGDGWQADAIPPALFRERWERIRGYAAEYGRADQMTDAALHLMVNIDDDAPRARQRSVEFLNHYYGEGVIGPDRLESWLAMGPPSAVVDKISTFIEAGCTTPVLRFTSADQLDQIQRCVAEVLPALKAYGKPSSVHSARTRRFVSSE